MKTLIITLILLTLLFTDNNPYTSMLLVSIFAYLYSRIKARENRQDKSPLNQSDQLNQINLKK